MLRLFHAGLVAGCVQALVVIVTTAIAAYSSTGHPFLTETSDMEASTGTPLVSGTYFLAWVQLLVALALTLTNHRYLDATASRLRLASRLMDPTNPDHATRTLLVWLTVIAILFVIFAPRPPPDTLLEEAYDCGCAAAASVAWAGLMSIGVAAFGANAHAAARAL